MTSRVLRTQRGDGVASTTRRNSRGRVWLLAMAALLVFAACGNSEAPIDFAALETPTPVAESSVSGAPLRFAVAPVLSAPVTSVHYRDLARYLGGKLDRPVELVLGKSYAEINAMLKTGEVALAIVCPKPYVLGKEDFGLELLAAPIVDRSTSYYSLLIVQRDSAARSLSDLRGSSFSFADPLSNSGYLVPTYQVMLLGEHPDSFFSRTIFGYSHDNAVRAVADGIAEATAINSLVFRYLEAAEPEIVEKVRVIEQWGPYGMNPVVVSPHLQPELKPRLQAIFLEMDQDPEGRAILSELMIDGFAVPPDALYDSIRRMRAAVSKQDTETGYQ